MNPNGWLVAFLLTQVIEMPIYMIAARSRPLAQRVGYAFGASSITHPIVWFCLPWQDWPYVPLLIAAESLAVGVEGAWGGLWRVPGPWRASLLANLASIALGSAIRWWLDGIFPQASR